MPSSHSNPAEVNVLAIVKGKERFIFLYDDDHIKETIQSLGRFAANPELNFTWYDAAILSDKIRQTQASHESQSPPPSTFTPWPEHD